VEAAALFKSSVSMVEIEVFSYCNRLCWFCPNKDGSRIGENQFMDEALYIALIDQLASIGYDKTITYSRYNEPLADEIILDRVRAARERLPFANLHANTNGDYLDLAYLGRLRDAGLTSLNIQVYLKNFERFDDTKVRAKAAQMIAKLGLPAVPTRDEPGEWLEYAIPFEGVSIRLYARNFDTTGTSRGDTVDIAPDYRRTSPCLMPFWSVYVDYDGSMVPCCNVRSDIPHHKSAVITRLRPGDSLFEAYAGRTLASWRRALMSFKEKEGVCLSCRFALENDSDETRQRVAEIAG
jgi:hypothetical protein